MGTIKTTNIETITGSGTLTLGQSGETISIPTNTTLGASGSTITIPSGCTITNNGTQTGFGGTNTPAFEVSLSADQTLSNGVETLVAFDTIHIDTGNYFSTSTRRFTPQVAGKYYIYGLGQQFTSGNTLSYITIRKNNVRVARFAVDNRSSANGTSNSHTVSAIVNMNGTTDYVDLYCNFNGTGTPVRIAAWSTGNPATLFGGYKIIE